MTTPCHPSACPRHLLDGRATTCGPLRDDEAANLAELAARLLPYLSGGGTDALLARAVLAFAEDRARLRASLGTGAPDYGHE